MDAQPVEPEQSPPAATKKILALTQFHATLAATTQLLLATNHHHQHQHQHQQRNPTLPNTLAYLHLWCATLGFTWWYAAQCGFGGGTRGWVQTTG
ncbi:hypothetical protein C8A01DRAFT_31417 [Parachaetomium inaequale]|uniref:Uncharacterized protein n=1 Tax=Parachaetomium inaequale TaxID=2588326 RepID=A0AAN6SW85_9PEZI|nr:hypothetical protein C8A01DRAFT_31417 [Parachaetomium inaequale]